MTFAQLRIIRLRERQGSGRRRLAGKAKSGPPPAASRLRARKRPTEAVRPASSIGVVGRGLLLVLGELGATARGALAPTFEPPVLPLLLALADSPRVVHP